MKKHIQNSQKPSIVIGETDHQRLNKLALAAADRLPEVSDGLLIELERALVVADTSVPRNVVRMGSTVEYEADTAPGKRQLRCSKKGLHFTARLDDSLHPFRPFEERGWLTHAPIIAGEERDEQKKATICAVRS
ncbi:hypothetical protein [Sinorhizobium fredii]|uniref:hypothetical protein n=1 Tax=Rhizobium fredii TaxID=380 RepID=UPI0009B70CEF|nr:hypothetical protein [Sinorhizobium fredii]WOS66189.1 hypothetical protein SFGR64A_21105 [Sinorhizobium fredii GR64]